jgi:hypothetical protein
MSTNPAQGVARLTAAIHGLTLTLPVGRDWIPADTRTVTDRDELASRVLACLDGIGDASTWASGRFRNVVDEALALGLVSAADIETAKRKHGLGGE